MEFESSDFFLELISIEINKHLQDQQITVNSIINLAVKYCVSIAVIQILIF